MEVFDDIDDKQYVFESLYLDILNKHAPQKQAHIRGNQIPFMNEQWRWLIHHCNKFWKKFTHQRTDANYAEYKKQRNKETNASQFGAKQLKIILKTSQRPTIHVHFWEAYRPFMHLRSSKQANDIMLVENDVVITDRKELAELFNNYFVHIIDDVQYIKENNFKHKYSAHPSIKQLRRKTEERMPYIILILNTPIRTRLKNYY